MKFLKPALLISSLFCVAATGFFLNQPQKAAANVEPKVYQTVFTIVCPVVGEANVSLAKSEDENHTAYKHCTKCATGVFLPHQDEAQLMVSKCTFCGVLEENQNTAGE